jgi:predicted ATPase
MLDLAQREGSATSLAFAHRAQMQVRYHRGDLVGVEHHFAHLSGFRDAVGSSRFPGAFVSAIGFAGQAAWILGYAEKAHERIAQALALARHSQNPFDHAVGRVFESHLYSFLREPWRAEGAAAQAFALSEEHSFPYIAAIARITMGWARELAGGAGEGESLIRQGLAGLAELGARLSITEYLTCLAEAQGFGGMVDEALIAIEEALQANAEELVYRPNTLICRGDLRLKLGLTDPAEADFREAIAFAQKMQAKAWELRATTSLARLLASQGRRDEARAMLAEIYNWFTEGFDTADLNDAKALLEGLAG